MKFRLPWQNTLLSGISSGADILRSRPDPEKTHQSSPQVQASEPETYSSKTQAKLKHPSGSLQSLSDFSFGSAPDLPALRRIMGEEADLRQVGQALIELMFAKGLRQGLSVAEAAVEGARLALLWRDRMFAMPLLLALATRPETKEAGFLGLAILHVKRGLYRSAVDLFSRVPRETVRALALPDYMRALAHEDRIEAQREADLLVSIPTIEIRSDYRLPLLAVLYGGGFRDQALQFAELLRSSTPQAGSVQLREKTQLRWFSRYEELLDKKITWHKAAEECKSPIFATIDYKQPDYSSVSSNIGDYIQTIAMLGCLARLQDIEICGDKALTDLFECLRGRVQPERVHRGLQGKIALTAIDRDASHDAPPPPGTWAIIFGWHMHKTFQKHVAFPFHPNINPIFLSFHCNKVEMLSDEGIEYLKRFSPIGCRDWTTVYYLRSRGVAAFFSGCITTTIDTLFDTAARDGKESQTAFVDAAPKPDEAQRPHKAFSHAKPAYRGADLIENVQTALDLLDEYNGNFDRVVTSRLHAYVPCASIGLDVEFRPRRPSDVRFEGLNDLTVERLAAIQGPLLEKTAALFGMIAKGTVAEQVYAAWAELCRPELEQANSICSNVPNISLAEETVEALAASPISRRTSYVGHGYDLQSPVHVALSADEGYAAYLCVAIDSVVRNSTSPIQFHVLTRGFKKETTDKIGEHFRSERCQINFLPCDDVDYGEVGGKYPRITVSTMDRLLLPELLPTTRRVVYLDTDILVLGDIAELFWTEMDGRPIAARGSIAPGASSGFAHLNRITGRLSPAMATEFRRRVSLRCDLAFPTFNAGVLVLDLQQLREMHFCREFLPFVFRYGINDQELLNFFACGNWSAIPSSWNSWPTQEIVDAPKLVHFVGSNKPWEGNVLPFSDLWNEYRSRLESLLQSF